MLRYDTLARPGQGSHIRGIEGPRMAKSIELATDAFRRALTSRRQATVQSLPILETRVEPQPASALFGPNEARAHEGLIGRLIAGHRRCCELDGLQTKPLGVSAHHRKHAAREQLVAHWLCGVDQLQPRTAGLQYHSVVARGWLAFR